MVLDHLIKATSTNTLLSIVPSSWACPIHPASNRSSTPNVPPYGMNTHGLSLVQKQWSRCLRFLLPQSPQSPQREGCIDEYVQEISFFASGYNQWHYGCSDELHEAESWLMSFNSPLCTDTAFKLMTHYCALTIHWFSIWFPSIFFFHY